MKEKTCAIVGAGAAALSAAQSMRFAGFEGRIVMFGDEVHLPYERPPLSKAALRGEVPIERATLQQADFYRKHSIVLQLGDRATRVDPTQRVVESARGEKITYDMLLLAAGATPRRLTVPGHELEQIHYLRTMDDCARIRQGLTPGIHALVLGSGFIGCEVAASLRRVGCQVTLVGHRLPLEPVLGREIGELYAQYHRGQGVDVRVGTSVAEFRGSTRVEQAVLSNGDVVACDLVVAGIGVSPSIDVAPPGIQLENGIVTDEFCRTNLDSVWAAGDVASSWRPRFGRRIRFEHFANASHQGEAAGKSILGKNQAYDPLPFFWSDQFDLHLVYYGDATTWDTCVFRGSTAEYTFSTFFLRDGRIDAACNVNRTREITALKRLVGRADIPASSLADDTKDLALLASSPAPAA